MSFDIRIDYARRLGSRPTRSIDVAEFIEAYNLFPAFADSGKLWLVAHCDRAKDWPGLSVEFEDHAPGMSADGTLDELSGTAEACSMCVSYGITPGLEDLAVELAIHLARHLDAHAWDLRSGDDLTKG